MCQLVASERIAVLDRDIPAEQLLERSRAWSWPFPRAATGS